MENVSPRLVRTIVEARAARVAAKRERENWRDRISDAVACPDNARLPRVRGAGAIHRGRQRMFNGLLVEASGYYGPGMTELLRRNRGSHEPQEEAVFAEVLRRLPAGARMIECGAYWGFYSMWFAREVVDAKVWLIEPESANLDVGRRNFALNGLHGDFAQAFVGAASSTTEPVPRICIDDFLSAHRIEHLDILHADIQGAEVEMLQGAARTLAGRVVDYVFISTHGADLHALCAERLAASRYPVAVSIRPDESYSFDGLLVAHREGLPAAPLLQPSRKPVPVHVP